MEYASSVWDPHLKKTRQTNRGSQRRAARFVKNCYTRKPGTVTNLLNELNWIPLKVRRTISRLTLYSYKNSYFCRTVKDWNALPSEIVNIKSADSFKKVLFEYFSQ